MTVVNRGATGAWHIFRGSDAREFLANIIVVASWPCRLKGPNGLALRGRLFGHDTGTFSLVFNADTIPDGRLREYHTHFVNGAKEEIVRKHAGN